MTIHTNLYLFYIAFFRDVHAFDPKYVYIGHKIRMKQPHDCSY